MNLVTEVPTTRRSHARIFISHRVEGGNDGAAAEKNGASDEAAAVAVAVAPSAPPPAPAPAPAAARPGGKDFSALLHSSAHQEVEQQPPLPPPPKKPPHFQQPKRGVRKWTLVIEGGLLIKHLDHASAKTVDAKLDAGLPILGADGTSSSSSDGTTDQGTLKKAEIPTRDQWRGGVAERENEKDIDPISFTHLFDKLEVEMKVIKLGQETPLETSAITRSGLGSVPEPLKPEDVAAAKTFTWERTKSNTPDSHAFFISHDEESEFKPMGGKVFKSEFKVDHLRAKIKLYRRQGESEANYMPSHQMCNVFFPTFIGKRAVGEIIKKDKSGKSKKRKRDRDRGGGGASTTLGGNDATMPRSNSSANLENEASNSSIASNNIPPGKEAAFASRQQAAAVAAPPAQTTPSADHEDKDFHIPNTITMDDALHAIFFYIRTRNLQDATDLSIINNDDALSNLFGCSRMLFSAVRNLLIEKQLLVKVEPCTEPIIFNYDMTLDGAEPLTKKCHAKASSSEDALKMDTDEMTTRRKTAKDVGDVQSDSEQPEDIPQQTMISCDIDVEVPNLFHVRTRDLLRRIKYREFEYTFGRIKAVRSLMSTKVDEETAKQVVGDAVAGKGYAPYHKQVWMALAKNTHEGGEAQRAALIDLRTTSLIEKLEEQCSKARGYWDVVHSCRSLCEEKK